MANKMANKVEWKDGEKYPRLQVLQRELERREGNCQCIERSSMNSWDDKNFVAAVKPSNEKKPAQCGEYPVLPELRSGLHGMACSSHETIPSWMTSRFSIRTHRRRKRALNWAPTQRFPRLREG